MKTNALPPTNSTTRRRFLHGISASTLLLASSRAMARESAVVSLRNIAGGKPLIGTAVATQFENTFTPKEMKIIATQFDSVTPENCMKWQVMCLEEGAYRFEDIDLLMKFAIKNKQSFVGHTLLFNRDGDYPKWLFRDGNKEGMLSSCGNASKTTPPK